MPLFKSARTWSLVLGISFCGLGGYIIYQYFKGSRKITLQVMVPSDSVGFIIGRCGHRIKQIEEDTGASIHIDRYVGEGQGETTCHISGSYEECISANAFITQLVTEYTPIFKEVITIPQQTFSMLLSTVSFSALSSHTGAVIIWPRDFQFTKEHRFKEDVTVTVKGTREQLDAARALIEKLLEECVHVDSRARRMGAYAMDAVEERLSVVGSGPFEVYISAMVDPSRFWLQVVGPKAQQLDLLVEEMTEFYRDEHNRRCHTVNDVEVGDLVAATFQYDKRWYRAEVLQVNAPADFAELYYVDYGDTDKVPIAELYELKMEYLQLHFQAIECFLSRVGPVGDAWSPEAIDKFEDWAHVAQWRKLSAKLYNYSSRVRTRAQRGPSPMPGIELFDVVDDADFNIGDELVRQGLAAYEHSAPSSRSSSSLGWERF